MEPATGSKIQPKKKLASNGNDSIGDGEILIDNAENRWKLGRSIGVQGYGEVYLASSKTDEPVGSDAEHIVKVELHKNGSLFMEINCYLRMARSDMIDKWKKDRNLKHVGLSRCMGSETCRIIPLHGIWLTCLQRRKIPFSSAREIWSGSRQIVPTEWEKIPS
jgi:vaccinia related kinase